MANIKVQAFKPIPWNVCVRSKRLNAFGKMHTVRLFRGKMATYRATTHPHSH